MTKNLERWDHPAASEDLRLAGDCVGPSDVPPGRIRCFLVDDERLARTVVTHLVSRHTDFTIVGEAADLHAAWDGIQRTNPDVLFLDIELDRRSGFELVRKFRERSPAVVFVTAYDHFAVQAFDVHAVDYLMKPVDPERFDAALDRVRERLGRSLDAALPMVSRRNADVSDAPMFVQAGRGGCFISPKDILLIRSDRNYSSVSLADGQVLIVRQTLARWMERLPVGEFLQLDRTLIVNLLRICRTEFGSHSGIIHLNHAREPVELGRQASMRLRDAMIRGPWNS